MSDYIGTTVVVPGANRGSGILRFVGQIRGKSGTYGGIELQGPVAASRGKNNGDVDDVRYFDVSQPMTGLFLSWDRLRAANPSLSSLERLKARSLSLKRDSVYTPTPSRRSSPSPKNFNGNSGSHDRCRPSLWTDSANRDLRSGVSLCSVTSASPNTAQVTPKHHDFPASDSSAELSELRKKLDQKTRDFEREETILLELQATVAQLHPVLEECERNIEEKERKLKKQKNEYEKAREEWRLSLDLMLSSQQEAETLYEMQINDLKDEIRGLVAKIGDTNSRNGHDGVERSVQMEVLRDENELLKVKLSEIELELKMVQSENKDLNILRLQTQEQSQTSKSAASGDSAEIELLKKKVETLTEDVTLMEIVLQDTQARSGAKSARITELEIQLSELKSQDVNNILQEIGSLSLADWEREKALYTETIDSLTQKLGEASKFSSEIVGISKRSGFELTTLRENEREKEAEIARLHEKINALESEHISAIAEKEHPERAEIRVLTEEQASLELTIFDLKKELEQRPSYDESELTELQHSLEIVERLHREEIAGLQKEFEQSKLKNAKMEEELTSLKHKLADFAEKTHEPESASPRISPTKQVSIPRVKGGLLPIYKPAKEIDPSEGRDDWCGLCERDGHDSLNCPYENDIF